MRKLCSVAHYIEANTLKSMLSHQGVDVFVKGEALIGAIGELPATLAELELWVAEKHFVHAQQLLVDYQTNESRGVHWNCRECGEENAPNFEICWQCESEK